MEMWKFLFARVKFEAFSECPEGDFPLREMNFLSVAIKQAVVKSATNSRRIAFLLKQTSRQIHVLNFLFPTDL